MSLEDEFTEKVMYVLNDRVINALQNLPDSVFAAVVGGKALNALVDIEYQTPTIDWDINVFSNIKGVTDSQARDFVGRKITDYMKDLLNHYGFRIEVIENYYGIKILDIQYQVSKYLFTDIYGKSYRIGHVNLITNKLGRLSVVDLVPIKPTNIDKYIEFDKVNYLDLKGTTETLLSLINNKTYKKKAKAIKRIENIKNAIKNDSLSCNFYRVYYKNGVEKFGDEIFNCVRDTLLGPLDPIINNNRQYPRNNILVEDIVSHDDYYNSLSQKEQNIVYRFTDSSSSIWNAQLNHNAIYKDDPVIVDREVDILQQIIQNAPPLREETIVFMTNRYLFYPNRKSSNYDFKKGQSVGFYSFLSTSYDNYYNPYAFIDLFSPGVAYAIKIPKGSRVLIIGRNSKYGNEKEVLFPYNSTLKIDDVKMEQITYKDNSDLWYDEMITYSATFVPKLNKNSVKHIDIPMVKTEKIFNKLILNPDFKSNFAKIWLATQLQ